MIILRKSNKTAEQLEHAIAEKFHWSGGWNKVGLAKSRQIFETFQTTSALEALRNALYKFKTYLLAYLLAIAPLCENYLSTTVMISTSINII